MPGHKDHVPTILIADDIEANRELLTEILSAEHYRIVHAQDGEEALQPLEEALCDTATGTGQPESEDQMAVHSR